MIQKIIFSVFLLSALELTAQSTETTSRWNLQVGSGASLPMGDYTQYHPNQFGCAKIGGQNEIALQYSLRRGLGIYIGVQYAQHQVDALKMAENLLETYITASQVSVTTKGYQLWSVFGGLSHDFPLGTQWKLQAILGAGLLQLQTPEIEQVISTLNVIERTITHGQTAALMGLGKVQIGYQWHPNWSIGAFAAYQMANPSVRYTTDGIETAYKQQVAALSAGLHIGYQF